MKSSVQIVPVAVPNDTIMEDVTNAYIVGEGPVVIFDPGSVAGTEALLAALARLGNPAVRDIILTHAHPDHAAGAAALRERTGAPVWLHPAELPVAERMGLSIPVDETLRDGQQVQIGATTFEALLTPGHSAGHVVFIERESGVTLAGDMVHGAGTVGIFPPFGSMQAYLDSLQRMLERGVTRLLPGHGPALDDGPATLRRYIAHRLEREAQILALVGDGLETVDAMVPVLYPEIQPRHVHAGKATIRAHLEKLIAEGHVVQIGEGATARYFRTDRG